LYEQDYTVICWILGPGGNELTIGHSFKSRECGILVCENGIF